jgi:hypothetical protein
VYHHRIKPQAKQTTAVTELVVVFVFASETPLVKTALFGGVSPTNTPAKNTYSLLCIFSLFIFAIFAWCLVPKMNKYRTYKVQDENENKNEHPRDLLGCSPANTLN